eukprot:768437-Pleurochrysis_carterae.AAC.1
MGEDHKVSFTHGMFCGCVLNDCNLNESCEDPYIIQIVPLRVTCSIGGVLKRSAGKVGRRRARELRRQ